MILGFALLILGVLFLLKNLGIIYIEIWEIAWPAILIVLGLKIIFRKKNILASPE